MEEDEKEKILTKLLKSFIEEDKKEPFFDREYSKETKRIYNNLIEGNGVESQDRAIYDIISDIFKFLSVNEDIYFKIHNLNNSQIALYKKIKEL